MTARILGDFATDGLFHMRADPRFGSEPNADAGDERERSTARSCR